MKWQLCNSTPVLETPWLRVLRNEYLLPTGDNVSDYYVVERSDFVLVIAVHGEYLVMIRQYRPATDTHYLALPAGYISAEEDAVTSAERELREETGLTAVNTQLLGELHPLPGYVKSAAYVASCTVPTIDGLRIDPLEVDEAALVPWSEVTCMIARGEINEMQAIAAICLFLTRKDHWNVVSGL